MDPNQQAASGQTNTDPAAVQGNGQAAPVDNNPAQGNANQQVDSAPAAAPQGDSQQGDGNQGDAQGNDGQKPADIVYDFKMPDGMELDAEIGETLKEFAKEKNLSAEEAQKLVDLGVKMREKEAAAYQIEQTKWVEQIKADPEMGGAQLEANVAVAKKAVEAFGTPELKQLLDSTGFGNHPEVVRTFYKIGKAISEDKLVVGQGKPRGNVDPAKRLFPNQT